ncbi:MAG: hypothetical protein GTO02_21710 [Candidatus Dadabacteria bacterium]|nr:hypothetical protein [Candidatus Dadabacteria bacterium]
MKFKTSNIIINVPQKVNKYIDRDEVRKKLIQKKIKEWEERLDDLLFDELNKKD